ncbi:hypothetical protein IEO21_08176 [Rhodonia placenta]|uniref:Uncharacterized protein n=1 Tax=Rhodonia placenta TaxID=104341 RepID=A0A8H7TZM3_9APHY|nr:hypothetical protein IEO21_08176 [Postia placenta]
MYVLHAIVPYGHRYACRQTRSPTVSPLLQHMYDWIDRDDVRRLQMPSSKDLRLITVCGQLRKISSVAVQSLS